MVSQIMKTTIEIADDLFERVQRLTEEGLRLVLRQKQSTRAKLPPLVTVRGKGLINEFKNASWDKLRDEIYRRHGS